MTKARTATIISAVSVLAVGGLTWQFVLSPRMAEADSINTQAMDVETQNVMLTGRYNEAVTRAQQAPEVAAEAQALFADAPRYPSPPFPSYRQGPARAYPLPTAPAGRLSALRNG